MCLAVRFTASVVFSIVLVLLSLFTARITLCEIQTLNNSNNDLSSSSAALTQQSIRGVRIRPAYGDEEEEAALAGGSALEPPRLLPQNLRLVFLGDSVTRYQYLSLAYFLRHGRWFDPKSTVVYNNLMNAHSFHHPFHPDDDWNEFFLQSNRMLHPLEVCDCWRSSRREEILVERRYFYDAANNNMLVYINMNGGGGSSGEQDQNAVAISSRTVASFSSPSSRRGFYGRLNAPDIFGPNFSSLVGLPFGMSRDASNVGNSVQSIQWEYFTWADVIRHHIGSLDLAYNTFTESRGFQPYLILNAGLHPHNFDNPSVVLDVVEAADDIDVHAIWKTTTYSRDYVLSYQSNNLPTKSSLIEYDDDRAASLDELDDTRLPTIRTADTAMCEALGCCFNLTWTAWLRADLYADGLHFLEPVYRIWNEDLLEQLGRLPKHHEKLDRSKVLIQGSLPYYPQMDTAR